jgi:hypothetical protein
VCASPAHATTGLVWFENGAKIPTNKHALITAYGRLDFQSEEQGAVECNNVINTSLFNESEKGSNYARGAFEGWGSNACRAEDLEIVFKELGLPTTVYATAEEPLVKTLVEGEACSPSAQAEGKTHLYECKTEREAQTFISPESLHRANTSFPWKTELRERTEHDLENVIADTIGIGAGGKSCYPEESVLIEGEYTELAAPESAVPAGCIKIDVIAPSIPDEIEFYGSVAPAVRNGAGNSVDPSRLEFNTAGGLLVCAECHIRDPETPVYGTLKLIGAESQGLMLAK